MKEIMILGATTFHSQLWRVLDPDHQDNQGAIESAYNRYGSKRTKHRREAPRHPGRRVG